LAAGFDVADTRRVRELAAEVSEVPGNVAGDTAEVSADAAGGGGAEDGWRAKHATVVEVGAAETGDGGHVVIVAEGGAIRAQTQPPSMT